MIDVTIMSSKGCHSCYPFALILENPVPHTFDGKASLMFSFGSDDEDGCTTVKRATTAPSADVGCWC